MSLLMQIEENFKCMVATGKVDLSVITILDKLKKELIETKNKLLAKDDTIRNEFPKFHALETQLRIIEHMICRVKIAPEINDNPKVAEDALTILPNFITLHDSLAPKDNTGQESIIGLSSNLQISAMKCNLYPPTEKITKSINRKMLNAPFNRFVSRVGGEIERL